MGTDIGVEITWEREWHWESRSVASQLGCPADLVQVTPLVCYSVGELQKESLSHLPTEGLLTVTP